MRCDHWGCAGVGNGALYYEVPLSTRQQYMQYSGSVAAYKQWSVMNLSTVLATQKKLENAQERCEDVPKH